MKRLLILEDDPRLGPIMRDVLSANWRVALVSRAELALPIIERGEVDVAIVDRGLPGMSGEALVRQLRAQRIALPVLMLTALSQLHDKVEGLDAGANDYLVKPFEFEELNARLRALTRSYGAEATEVFTIGGWVFRPQDRTIDSPYSGRIVLTETETDLLQVFAREPDRIFSKEHLLLRVFAQGESETTVETYVHYLRKKTDRDIIHTIRGRGYRLGTLR